MASKIRLLPLQEGESWKYCSAPGSEGQGAVEIGQACGVIFHHEVALLMQGRMA